jgi:hypothetical protein
MLLVIFDIHIKTTHSLVFVAVVLLGSVVASLLFPREGDRNIHVDLPPDFDLPLSEESPELPEDSEGDMSAELEAETEKEPIELRK